ncbi:MAG: ATP-dependent DNA helicase RecG [Candidatus Izimaplasma bacterium HR2]|nr:MAG: ATP-dependent DNA helicase RecG [Candidatus Izimaplasma bacterium HR2]
MSDLLSIKGIGPKLKTKLNRNDIYDCFDIINRFPSRYEVYRLTTLKDAPEGSRVTLEGKVASSAIVNYIRKNFNRLSFDLMIEDRNFKVAIFNRDYLRNVLTVGEDIVVTGNIDRIKNTFTATTLKLKKNFKNEIEPIYNIDGVGDAQFQKLVQLSLKEYGHLIKDELPISLIKKYRLITYSELLNIVHSPVSSKDLIKIERRIKYEELFKFQMKMQYLKLKNKSKKSLIKKYDINLVKEFIKSLPFVLTSDQKKATNEIIKDIKSPYVMNRLLEGDTGSGKTVVSAISILTVLSAGFQVAMMAPTEILAKQHYETFKEYFKNYDYKIVYLSGKLTNKERFDRLEIIANNPQTLIIGTHALFSNDVRYNNLGYVITDEQHRFGVNQRKKLKEKGFNPDVLYMTATPIPRTLAISLFGDMDISIIKERPKNRIKVDTKLFKSSEMDLIYLLIDEQLKNNHQVYVVTPLILESETLDLSNAQKVYRELSDKFSDYYVGMLHSKISQEDKEHVMDLFKKNEINILVSTTVIEVGVDVANATLMVVLNSDRFGLSQLHQLRGRIGRSNIKSYCLLVYNDSSESKGRLEILEKTDDGFKLSEEDLKIRGPGDFFGLRQSGELRFSKASIVEDAHILEIARDDALEILSNKDSYRNNEYRLLFNYLKGVLRKANLD